MISFYHNKKVTKKLIKSANNEKLSLDTIKWKIENKANVIGNCYRFLGRDTFFILNSHKEDNDFYEVIEIKPDKSFKKYLIEDLNEYNNFMNPCILELNLDATTLYNAFAEMNVFPCNGMIIVNGEELYAYEYME